MYAVVQSLIDLRQIQGLFNDGIVDILYEFKDNWTSILHPRQWRFQREVRPAWNCTFRLQSTQWQFRPALHTGKNTRGITGGCGQTKNVTEPLLQFLTQTVGIPTNHELKERFSSQHTRPWLDQCTLQELQELPLKPDHLQRNKATNQDHPK